MVLVPEASAMLTEGTSTALTTMVMALLMAVAGLAQAELEVMMQDTTCPSVRDEVVKFGPLPALLPLISH